MSDTTSNTPAVPAEDHFDRLKRISAEKGAASIAAREAAIARSEDSSKDKPDSLRKVLDNPDASVKPFATEVEMLQAMRDPRYSTDVDYRTLVAYRISAGMRGQNPSTPPRREQSAYQRDLSATYRSSVSDTNRDVSVSRTLETFDVKPFLTRAEHNAAFRDPRYQRDGSYRALIAAKLAMTDTNNLL